MGSPCKGAPDRLTSTFTWHSQVGNGLEGRFTWHIPCKRPLATFQEASGKLPRDISSKLIDFTIRRPLREASGEERESSRPYDRHALDPSCGNTLNTHACQTLFRDILKLTQTQVGGKWTCQAKIPGPQKLTEI